MEPNKTFNLPFLSPNTPHNIPPINKPDICQLIICALSTIIVSAVDPILITLVCLTIVNNNKSYTSTKYPKAATNTGNDNSPICLFVFMFNKINYYYFIIFLKLRFIGTMCNYINNYRQSGD